MEDFNNKVKESAKVAVDRANEFLRQLNLSLHINWDYDVWNENDLSHAIGVYENGSVFDQGISISIHVGNLYKYFVEETERHPWTNDGTIIDEAVQTTVFHEMGHGIVEYFEDTIEYWDEDEELPFYDKNQEFCDKVLDNPEDSVEEFAWAMYDNQLEDCDLYKMIKLYLDNGNVVNEEHKTMKVIITEQDVRKMVGTCVKRVLNESLKNGLRKEIQGQKDYEEVKNLLDGKTYKEAIEIVNNDERFQSYLNKCHFRLSSIYFKGSIMVSAYLSSNGDGAPVLRLHDTYYIYKGYGKFIEKKANC